MTGIGFRKDFAEEFLQGNTVKADFIEVARKLDGSGRILEQSF
ncbi:MAG: hypothetical protein U5Q03_10970 [Bacteroidota bacterium]|nr:hypothetical protein [Bacteroidota bacterium]